MLELKNISFQVSDDNSNQKEIIKDINLKLNDHTFDKENGAIVCELLDATPTAASNSYLILTYNYDSFVEKGNMYIEKYEKVLQDILDLSHKLVFLTNEEWNKNKNEYIENIKNNVKYNYIDEESQVQEEAMDDFETDNIELNITDSTLKASGSGSASQVIFGGEVNATTGTDNKITVTGGGFVVKPAGFVSSNDTLDITIGAGVNSNIDVPEEYLAENAKVIQNADGSVTVIEKHKVTVSETENGKVLSLYI